MSNTKIVPYISIGVYRKYIDSYLALLTGYSRTDSTVAGIGNDLKIFLCYLECSKIRKIYIDTLHEYVRYLDVGRGNSDGTINRKICSCKNYFNHIAGKKDAGAGVLPLSSIIRVKTNDYTPTTALREEEVQWIIEVMDGTTIIGIRDRMLYGLIYNIGIRISEAVGLNLKDIDFHRKKISVTGKGGKTRILPLGKDAYKGLISYLPCRDEFLNSDQDDALFLSKKGGRLAVRTAQDNFKKYRNKVGELSLKRVTPHSLRHAFASHWIDAGSDKITLKAMLGHAKMETTEQYVHPSLEAQRKALENHPGSMLIEKYIKTNNLTGKFYTFKKSKAEIVCPHCKSCLTGEEKKYA